ncbi:hydroxymethylbilane synthase [Marinicellulosiphila megalodicopiae]|uniref:hydroxymethylbilane synthase n=1 Tax=Marinicellulosiphila megalodicopiae TaxID=2724896 RepID=UPI003BB0F1A1
MKELRIATRQSALAMWQAEDLQTKLQNLYPNIIITLVPMVSRGDQILDVALSKVGGKGLFTKELEVAMLENQADIAMHCIKDLPMYFPESLDLYTITESEDPTDAFVSNKYDHFDQLPQGAIVGTSSLRRQSQILAKRPDLKIEFLRGNVGTRLGKLDDGQYDAIILATAGLIRLELQERIKHKLDTHMCLPAAGQGALGIECRIADTEIHKLLAPLHHVDTAIRVYAERALIKHLEGGCQVPIAGYAQIENGKISMEARVAEVDGSVVYIEKAQSDLTDSYEQNVIIAEKMGKDLAIKLVEQGADAILEKLKADL